MGAGIDLWIVYDHPLDIPDFYVARRYSISNGHAAPTFDFILCVDLEPLREELSWKGLACIPRYPNDHPNVIEAWM